MIATDNVVGGLLDLQSAGRLAAGLDPVDFALSIHPRYDALWHELTDVATVGVGDVVSLRTRLDRLHQLGFEVEELEVVTSDDGSSMRYVPKVVEHGYHAAQLASLTGLEAGDNQARRMLQDISAYGAELSRDSLRPVPFNVAAVRWLDRRFEPLMQSIPTELTNRLQGAEIFHQLMEHQWYMAERLGSDVSIEAALSDYLQLLASAPDEKIQLGDDVTGELPLAEIDAATDATDDQRADPAIDDA
jgi:hypothetical protein